MRNTLATVLLVLASAACQPRAEPIQSTQAAQADDREGREYKAALSAMIKRADKIVVTEHSFQDDLYDEDTGKSLIPNEVVYGTRELNQQQKNLFLSTIDGLNPTTQDAFPACIFEPHHTVTFFADGKLISSMEICFQCGQVEWDATKATPPWSLYSGLATFIKAIGFEPERDWTALAKQHSQ